MTRLVNMKHSVVYTLASHLNQVLADEIAHVCTYVDSPMKAAAVALAALHTHRSTHASH